MAQSYTHKRICRVDTMCYKVCVVICVAVLALAIDVAQGQHYQYLPSINGWVKPYKVEATWFVAFNKCRDEGAELMAPLTKEMLAEMKKIIGVNNHSSAYHIDARARYVSGIYVSAKGVPIQNMPVTDMIDSLKLRDGRCLSMDSRQIRSRSCYWEMPYICYREKTENDTVSECGTIDKGYRFNEVTGNCYKEHQEFVKWDDAYTTCTDEGAYLAIINDRAEAESINKLFDFADYYIGLQALEGDGNWTSIHGEPVEQLYNTWYKGSQGRRKNKCAILYFDFDLLSVPCDEERYFLCEKSPQKKHFSN